MLKTGLQCAGKDIADNAVAITYAKYSKSREKAAQALQRDARTATSI